MYLVWFMNTEVCGSDCERYLCCLTLTWTCSAVVNVKAALWPGKHDKQYFLCNKRFL